MTRTSHWVVLAGAAFYLLVGTILWAEAPAVPARPTAPTAAPEEIPLTDEEFQLPLDDKTAAEVDRLIPLLNSPAYAEREAATEKLTEVGAPAFAKLRKAYADSDDLELKLRIERVVRTGYLDRYVFDKYGFLGVQLQMVDPARMQKGGKPVPTENALQIGRVIADTGASKAGLQAEDIVVALNGAALVGSGQDAVNRFSSTIRTFRPGTPVRLNILRNGLPIVIDAVVGRCPEESARARTVGFWQEYGKACDRFDEWWLKFFAPSPATTIDVADK